MGLAEQQSPRSDHLPSWHLPLTQKYISTQTRYLHSGSCEWAQDWRGNRPIVYVTASNDGERWLLRLVSRTVATGVDGPAPQFMTQDAFAGLHERKVASRDAAGNTIFEVPVTYFNVVSLLSKIPRANMALDQRADVQLTEILLHLTNLNQVALLQEQMIRDLEAGELTDADSVPNGVLPLKPFQARATSLLEMMGSGGVFMEQGTGKTPIAVRIWCDLAARHYEKCGKMLRVLIVCPRSVRTNWENETRRFATIPGQITVLRGGKYARLTQLVDAFTQQDGAQWTAVVSSYECVRNTPELYKMTDWHICFLDESHFIKDTRTKRWKTFKILRDRCERRYVMTGTPITNTIMDLFSQLEFIRNGCSGFTSMEAFRKFYGRWERVHASGGMSFEKLVDFQNVPILQELMSRTTLRLTKKQVLPQLSTKQYSTREISMTKEQVRLYELVQKKLLIELEEELSGAETSGKRAIVVNHVFVKLLRLAQITSGIIVTGSHSDNHLAKEILENNEYRCEIWPAGRNPKIDIIIDLLLEMPRSEKMVVWSCFVPLITELAKTINERQDLGRAVMYYGAMSDKDRDAAVTAFNEDSGTRLLVGNQHAGGVGLNLLGRRIARAGWTSEWDTRCTRVVFAAQDWSAVSRSQAEDRTHRIGVEWPVEMIDLVVPGTIDQEIRERVCRMRQTAESVQDLRQILRNLRDNAKILKLIDAESE